MPTFRTLKWRVPLVLAVAAFCFYLATPPLDPDGAGPAQGKLKLGLDLQGGMHLALLVKTETLPEAQREGATERALEIIRNRIDQFGVAEPSIQREGVDRIVVQLPGVSDRQRALDLIGRTALLQFKLVSDKPLPRASAEGEAVKLPPGTTVYKQKDGTELLIEDPVLLEGKELTNATVSYSSDWNEPVVAVTLNSKGAKTFADITTKNVERRLAIILDDVVQSAPAIREPIMTGEAQISGSFGVKEANDLAITLRAGALPAPIQIEEERTVGPSLGKDSVRQGFQSMAIASVLVVVFMGVYYLRGGIIADIALLFNLLMTIAALAYFRATLTMPGIAGMILSVGMAVDTNVLILERIREELHLGKPYSTAVSLGYRRCFGAIIDTHLTTLITALILYKLGTGPVRGFAVTLAIGLLGSFFTGVFVTHVLTDLHAAWREPKTMKMFSFLHKVPNFDFLKPRKIFYIISAAVMLGSLGLFVRMADQRLGIDFSGGVLQEFRFQKPVEVDKVRAALKAVDLETAVIQNFGGINDIVIRTGQGTEKKVKETIQKSFTDNPHEIVRIETVGPVVGRDLRKKSLWAAIFSLLSILVYLAFRFELRYSLAAIIALFHDALVCLGAVILTGREISIPVLAAVLTIVGYSVNDTIVTFDRVRENIRKPSKKTYGEIVNNSINETLSRTILTSLTVLLVVVCLYVFGGPVINDFAFTMLVGLISGTYSTVFVACPMVVDWPSKRGRVKK